MGNVEINLSDVEIDVDSINPNAPVLTDEQLASVEDIDDPLLSAVSDELDELVIEGGEAESPIATFAAGDETEETKKPLTDDQKTTVIYMFKEYLNYWYQHEDVLGVQLPFYLNSNDNADDLGILGQMLVLANVPLEAVRDGSYTYNDLTGMIMNFQYGDQLGVEIYGEAVENQREAALKFVKESGAKTEAQKLLALNTWLAQENTFDMSYIMNQMDPTDPIMNAPEPVQHEHYQQVYDALYAAYTEQLTAQFRGQYTAAVEGPVYQGVIKEIVKQTALDKGMDESAAAESAEEYIAEHADAINADPQGFVTDNFGEGAQAIIEAADAQVSSMVDQMMETQGIPNEEVPELDGMTANQLIPIYADQAAAGLTTGVLGYWEGNHIGALAEGASVCMGYAKAMAYLIQAMHPDIYGVNGENSDMSDPAQWKTPYDVEIQLEDGTTRPGVGVYEFDENNQVIADAGEYNVDMVRITFNASVSMYGVPQPDFSSDHFWNAVKLDGKWYYIDPCYTDVWNEVMIRDRVEVDGFMNHTYFLISDPSIRAMFDGNYSDIKTLYQDLATHKEYEDSWFARIVSNISYDENGFYYLYDSTDLITMMEEYGGDDMNQFYDQELDIGDADYKIVYHPLTEVDRVDETPDVKDEPENGDIDYDTLIDFTHKDSEDDDESYVAVLRGDELVKDEMLTALYEQMKADQEVYPAVDITPVYYQGKVYFNLSNCILSYDVETGDIAKVTEYNTVYAKRNDNIAFGGMAFDVVDSAAEADFTFQNHPIAGIALKDDGQLYVSIATNLSYISGKADLYDYASEGYGYEYEESDYNADYNSYAIARAKEQGMDEEQLEQFGYTLDLNDNDEFMWVANAIDTLNMAHLTGSSHSYAAVSVPAACGRNAFTEDRCTECGVILPDSRQVQEDTALEHHFVEFDETYYTTWDDVAAAGKDPADDQVTVETADWESGTCYVCPLCGYHVNEPVEPTQSGFGGGMGGQDEDYEQEKAQYDEDLAYFNEVKAQADTKHVYILTDTAVWNIAEDGSATVTFNELTCSICGHIAIDCVQPGVSEAHPVLDQQYTLEATLTGSTTDANGVVWNTYEVSGEVEGYQVTGSYIVQAGSSTGTPVEPEKPGDGDNQGNQGDQGGQTGGGSQPVDEHPDIAEGIANGTWGGTATTSASGSAEAPAPAAQQTAAIPETADEMPLQAVTIAAVLSGIAAAALVLLRKRNTDR